MFTAQDVVKLREKTGAGMLDCKKALAQTDGDMEKAIDFLREKGMATAAKKADRIAAEGAVGSFVNDNAGALVEVNCETDFVSKGDEYKQFVKDVAKFVCENEVESIEKLIELKNADTIAITAKIGEKIAIRRFEKYLSNGVIETYIHMGGKVGVMINLDCAKNEQTKELAHDLALQIAAAKPLYVAKEDVPQEVLEKEKEILKVQAINEGKPANIAERMVEGRIKKYYEDFCLLNQKFVKDPNKTIEQVIGEVKATAGDVTVVKFARFEMGEGLEKRSNDFAAEVASQTNK